MGVFRVELDDGRVFDVEADQPPTPEDLAPFLNEPASLGPGPQGEFAVPPETLAAVPETLRDVAATGVEVAAPVAGGIVGSAAGPLGAAGGAAAGGAVGSALGDLIRGEDVSGRKALASAVVSAIPGGAATKIGAKTVAGRVATHAVEGAVIGAGSAEVGSLIQTGEHASPTQVAGAALLGAGLGGGIGALSGTRPRSTPPAAAMPEAAPTPTASPARSRIVEQAEIFDDAGYVRPTVTEWSDTVVEGATARAGKQLVNAVKAEGKEAVELLANTQAAQDKQRLFRQVGELFEQGQLDAPGLLRELEERGLSMPEFIRDHYLPSVTRGARLMQQLSSLAKHLEKQEGMDEALTLLQRAGKPNRVVDFLNKLNDARRASLISQVKTGVRNAYSQGLASVVDLIESGLTGGVTGMRDNVEAMIRASSRVKATAEVDRLIGLRSDLRRQLGKFEYSAPELFDDAPVLRSTIGRMTEWTTAINRWQETFYRNAKVLSYTRQALRKRGLDVDRHINDPKKLDELGILDEAVEKALELTFAAQRPGGINTALTGIPKLLITSIAPFPRYMANAAVFVAKRNPLGLVRLATQNGRANASQVMAEATTGTLLLGGALALRFGEHAGDRWYEAKVGNKVVDLRGAGGPFVPYLFAAEAIRQYLDTGRTNFRGSDYVEGLLSMNRLAGTSLSLLSWLQGDVDDPESWNKGVSRLIGDWVAGFSVPAKNLKDLLTILGREEEGVWRDIREYPLTGPTRANIPGLTEQLPEAVRLTTGERAEMEHPVLSGVFGLNVKSIDLVESELARLNLPVTTFAPKTGIPKVDRELYRRVGKVIAAYGPQVVSTDAYQNASPVQKRVALRGLFKTAREAALRHLEATNPRAFQAYQAKKKLRGDTRRLLIERGVDVQGILQRFVDSAPEGDVTFEAVPEEPVPASPAPSDAPAADPILQAAQLTGADPTLIRAVVQVESGGNPNALAPVTPHSGGRRATGLMQLLPQTFESLRDDVEELLGRPADIHDPLSNLVAGSLLYMQHLEETGGDLVEAAKLYHGGPNRRIHGRKTRAYARKIADTYAALQE